MLEWGIGFNQKRK